MSLQVRIEKRLSPAFALDIAFEAAQGVTALFGASGAGKSASLACIAGVLRPDAGKIVLDGEALFGQGVDVPMERRGLGWVFQDARLFPHLTVEKNLRYGLARARGRKGVEFGPVVEVLGIAPLLARYPKSLSGGEKQRVAIGRALLSQPRLLLMDEPLAALDAPRKAEILPFVEEAARAFKVPTLYVSHSLAEVAQLADRMVVLEDGRVAAEGGVAEVAATAGIPLFAGRADSVSVVEATVEAHDKARGLTRLSAGLVVPLMSRPVGGPVRALILARDVMIATVEPKGLSARNLIPAEVVSLEPHGEAVSVKLKLESGAVVISSVTRDAASELKLAAGLKVWAIVKSVAVEGGLLSALS